MHGHGFEHALDVALIGPELEENLSLRYLAASLGQSGHPCRIIPFSAASDIPRVVRTVLRSKPGLLGLSLAAQSRWGEFLELVQRLRSGGYRGHITAGGHFASLRAEDILRDAPGIDTVLHHEGELRVVQLAGWLGSRPGPGAGVLAGGDPPEPLDGISWRDREDRIRHRPPRRLARLDDLPTPVRRRPGRTLGYPFAPLVSSRGCAGDCSFCSIRAWHRQLPGARLRLRSPEGVAAEMAALHRRHGVRIFIFHDDDFIHPHAATAFARCRQILGRAQAEIGRPFAFVIKCRPDDVQEELFAYLHSMGLSRVYVGIESHAASGLATLNRRVRPEDNERALSILDRLGIYSCFNLLVFDPDTTLPALEENLAFLRRHGGTPFDIARTELYAGAALEERMIREGRALGNYRGRDYRLLDTRAEEVFRLFREILWERHFGGRSILHRTQDLGLRLSILRRFHPEGAPAELAERVGELIREVNGDTVECLEAFCRFAAERENRDPAGREEFVREMRDRIDQRVRGQSRRWISLLLELSARAGLARLGLAERPILSAWPQALGRAALSAPCAAVALAIGSCGDQTRVCDPPPPPVERFSTDIEPALNQTCATADCHDVPAAAAGLVLTAGRSYDALVNVASTQVPGLDLVEPAQEDSSYLVYKLEGTQAQVGGSGDPMPPGEAPDSALTRKIREWIRRGAPND